MSHDSLSIVQMSLSGGAMIVVTVLIRALALHKLPKRFFPAVWSLILVRLLAPVSVPAGFSIYSLLNRPSAAAAEPTGGAVISMVRTDAAVGKPVAGAPSEISLWGMVWLIGVLACGTYFAAAYYKCRREFREALPVHGDFIKEWTLTHRLRRPVAIRQSDRITAPLTYGIFRPVILLPKSTDWNDREALSWVLAHEWVHIRRFDGVFKLLLTAALCVHWFNPLVWLMAFLGGRDIELACDEAVLQWSARPEEYALTLIRMEEKKSGLPVMGNHFSKNSLEERIKAMLTRKKTSLAALLAAILLVGGTGAVFATSAKADYQDASLRPGAEAETTYSTEAKDSLLSYTDADGITYYSWDEGKTWTPMTDEEFAAAYPDQNIQWWTAEEYADWLENEKQELQSVIGSQGWTASTGWFTWTQEMVDETIAEYEEVLTMIENGYLVSKSVDGDENTMLVMNPLDRVLGSGDGSYTVEKEGQKFDSNFENVDYESLFEDYKRCGLTFQNNDGNLYWNGQRVRIFADGAEFDGGYASQYEHYDPEGVIDVRTVRERVDNGDGSYDPMGPLVRLEEFEPEQMFLDALDCQIELNQMQAEDEARTAAELAPYLEFGLTYSFDQFQKSSDWLSMTWNGQPVRSLFDPECQLWIANSLGAKGMDLEVVYKDGEITGLRESQESASVHAGAVIDAEATAAESDGDDGSGETIAQRMERYAPYGVSYQEIGGKKMIRYKGKTVDSFADITPDGSVFSVGSTDGGEIVLVTDYDEDGTLKGVKAMMSFHF